VAASGTEDEPLVVGAYGTGDRPLIRGRAPACRSPARGSSRGTSPRATDHRRQRRRRRRDGGAQPGDRQRDRRLGDPGGGAHPRPRQRPPRQRPPVGAHPRARGRRLGRLGGAPAGEGAEVAHNVISGSDVFSYDNGRDGAAVEVFGARGSRVHHNRACQNDAFTEFGDARSDDDVFGPVRGTRVIGNTVLLTGADSEGFVCGSGCGPDILVMRNNVVEAVGKAGYSRRALRRGLRRRPRRAGRLRARPGHARRGPALRRPRPGRPAPAGRQPGRGQRGAGARPRGPGPGPGAPRRRRRRRGRARPRSPRAPLRGCPPRVQVTHPKR
jgi:hypothetical protein